MRALNVRQIIHLLAHATLIITLPVCAGGAVYQWVDTQGVTHFSETPPAATGVEVTRIELDPAPAAGFSDDYFSVVNQAMRMERRRLEAEAARTEHLQAQAAADRARAAAAAATEPAPAPDPEVVYLPRYPYHYPQYRQPRGWHQNRQYPRSSHRQSGPWPVQTLHPPGPRPYRLH